jgi:hypothetical protein
MKGLGVAVMAAGIALLAIATARVVGVSHPAGGGCGPTQLPAGWPSV